MPLFTPENEDLLRGQQEGYKLLENNTTGQIRNVKRLMDRYGTANADYFEKMKAAQLQAEAGAKLRLDAHLAKSQLRSRIHEQKLAMLQKAYKRQEKDERVAMWAAALGSVGQMAPGLYGSLTAPSGPAAGEMYTDLSGFNRTSN